mmetsp:Transcript_41872/g.64090  ORF Transcript_41872/g.64090 Transcript_41872/m.64090 type:complete len:144 (+) Transcript_41872:2644-3075(+)
MIYKYVPERNSTYLVALLQNNQGVGQIASFQIDSDLHLYSDQEKFEFAKEQKKLNSTTLLPRVPQKKRDRMEIAKSLINKLLDEIDNGSDEYMFSTLDDEEQELLLELAERVEFYFDIGGPLIVILIPACIWWFRSRIQSNRI